MASKDIGTVNVTVDVSAFRRAMETAGARMADLGRALSETMSLASPVFSALENAVREMAEYNEAREVQRQRLIRSIASTPAEDHLTGVEEARIRAAWYADRVREAVANELSATQLAARARTARTRSLEAGDMEPGFSADGRLTTLNGIEVVLSHSVPADAIYLIGDMYAIGPVAAERLRASVIGVNRPVPEHLTSDGFSRLYERLSALGADGEGLSDRLGNATPVVPGVGWTAPAPMLTTGERAIRLRDEETE